MTREEIELEIEELEEAADACEEIGSNFSAANMREEAKRLQKLLTNL